MTETETDFKVGDSWQSDHEHNKEDALDEMYKHAECIAQRIEHYINHDYLTIALDNLDEVYSAVKEIRELAHYTYNGIRFNHHKEYNDIFEYNFTSEIKDFLTDHLGYDWSVDK